ncbi:MAG: TRAP transporter substrate-binding protein [Burkholderiaceae bacterium]
MKLQSMKSLGIATASVAFWVASMGGIAAEAEAKEWRGWNIHVTDYPVSHGMEKFTSLIKERSGGRLSGKTYHSGVLGKQPDAIEQIRLGGIDFAVFSLGPMGQVIPETNVVSLPFIFKGVENMHTVMDGPIGEEISAGMAKKGIVALAWYDAGARSFYNSKKPITSPADVKGMKVRVMNNDLFVGMIEAMGGNATPMAFAEVFQSLKTGVIDGAENNPPSYESTSHFEAAKFYSISEHLIIPECLCISKMTWDGLSAEDKVMVKKAARESADLQRSLWVEREKKSMEKVQSGGTEVNQIADKASFQKAMAPVYDQFLAKNPELKGLVEKIQATK